MLAARPGWSAAAIICLAIATGANTAAFTLVNGLLLRPLPFEEPRQLVMVALREPTGTSPRPFALREYRDLAEPLASDDEARMAQGEIVSGNYFETLHVKPFLGRLLDESAVRDRSAARSLRQRAFQILQPLIDQRPLRLFGEHLG